MGKASRRKRERQQVVYTGKVVCLKCGMVQTNPTTQVVDDGLGRQITVCIACGADFAKYEMGR